MSSREDAGGVQIVSIHKSIQSRPWPVFKRQAAMRFRDAVHEEVQAKVSHMLPAILVCGLDPPALGNVFIIKIVQHTRRRWFRFLQRHDEAFHIRPMEQLHQRIVQELHKNMQFAHVVQQETNSHGFTWIAQTLPLTDGPPLIFAREPTLVVQLVPGRNGQQRRPKRLPREV